jgi:UDPglucose 6-dehydrogenase
MRWHPIGCGLMSGDASMKICVVGTGYVGLVAGACFADTGHNVTCVDIDEGKITRLKDGILPIYEPGLAEIVRKNLDDGRLTFTTDGPTAVQAARAVFIAVGTPPDEDGSADLRHVLTVAAMVGDNMNDHKIVVVKSTVPVGTCDRVRAAVQARTDHPFSVVSNPEFLKEGAAVQDFLKPDRIVIGLEDDKTREAMEEMYEPFVRTGKPIFFMDLRSSEMTKYASNALLATKISFINEVATLCEQVGADVNLVRKGMGSDPRIGPHFIFPGVGYGGSCFPKDIKALVRTGRKNDVPMRILEAVEEVNADQKRRCFERVVEVYGADLSGRAVAVWGLAFKPRTDDMREAPSLVTINALLEAGATVRATDPIALESAREIFGETTQGLDLLEDEYACLDGADALVICTEWNDYRNPDFDRVHDLMKAPVIVDGRNLYKPHRMKQRGFTYYSIGRPSPQKG